MKTVLFILISAFLSIKMQSQRKTDFAFPITGIYKVSNSQNNWIGYVYFKEKRQYYYFGKAEYNHTGKFDSYCTFNRGFWKIDKNNILIIRDSVNKNIANNGFADSVLYETKFSSAFDSIYFSVQIFGENGLPLKNELVSIKPFNKLLESDASGKVALAGNYSKAGGEQFIEFMGNEPYYKTSIALQPPYNYHQLKVYLRKIPAKGFLPVDFVPKNWTTEIKWINKDTFRLGNAMQFTKADKTELKNFIEAYESVNPIFQSEFSEIKRRFKLAD